jgi:hypothetical protein
MSILGEPIKYIWFHNDTDLPILISAWSDGSNILQQTRISPQEKRIVHSSVGEWHMDSMFEAGYDREAWATAGLENHLVIGKFRSSPCASGNYSWMEYYEPFDCIYTKTDNSLDLVTFIKNR